jgi:hypothetical protein
LCVPMLAETQFYSNAFSYKIPILSFCSTEIALLQRTQEQSSQKIDRFIFALRKHFVT